MLRLVQTAIMSNEIKEPDHRTERCENGKWVAFLEGVLVTDLKGRAVEFDTEADARAFLDEAATRSSSVDN